MFVILPCFDIIILSFEDVFRQKYEPDNLFIFEIIMNFKTIFQVLLNFDFLHEKYYNLDQISAPFR
jgi:hypothetical protein